ncbi:hypothetical protein FRB96_003404 [Tulasnella sp. 330]|nr:hypothetical protein FRB96_003404 [Tulasnella sp. 330]
MTIDRRAAFAGGSRAQSLQAIPPAFTEFLSSMRVEATWSQESDECHWMSESIDQRNLYMRFKHTMNCAADGYEDSVQELNTAKTEMDLYRFVSEGGSVISKLHYAPRPRRTKPFDRQEKGVVSETWALREEEEVTRKGFEASAARCTELEM